MRRLDINNYTKLSSQLTTISSAKLPIFIENSILHEYVNWNDDHISGNPINTLTEDYSNNKEKAISTRITKLLHLLRDKLELAKQLGRPITMIELHTSEYSTQGKKSVRLFFELLIIGDDKKERIHTISHQNISEHKNTLR